MKRGGTPAMTIIAATIPTMMIDVPRSGCFTMRASGTAAIKSRRMTSYIFSPSVRRAQNVAMARIKNRTANSLGWIWMVLPKLYQRWAPRALLPDDEDAGQREERQDVERRRDDLEPAVVDARDDVHQRRRPRRRTALALEVVVGVLPGVDERLASGAVDHDDARSPPGRSVPSRGRSRTDSFVRSRSERALSVSVISSTSSSCAPSKATPHHHRICKAA